MVSLRYWPPNTLLILRPPIFPNTGPPPFGAVLSRPFPTCATRRCATQRYIVAPTDMHTNTQQQLYSLPPGRDCLGVSRATLYRLMERGELGTRRVRKSLVASNPTLSAKENRSHTGLRSTAQTRKQKISCSSGILAIALGMA